jgi:hypothetical protein
MSVRESTVFNNMSKLTQVGNDMIELDIPSCIRSLKNARARVPNKGKMSDRVYHRLLLSKLSVLRARQSTLSPDQVSIFIPKDIKQKIKNSTLM